MKKRINKYMILIAVIAVLSTALLASFVFSFIIKHQVFSDLRRDCEILNELSDIDMVKNYKFHDIRITLVDENGIVQYDSSADAEKMADHSERPEIAEAISKGEGSSVRQSETLGRNTYYYAVKTDNGGIIRVSADYVNALSLFGNLLPLSAGLIAIMAVLCFVITRILTKKIIKPIEKIADNIDLKDSPEYEELVPVVNMLREQHENILNSAKVRQEFSANVSHELKTPLTIISGYAELIENGMADENSMMRFAGEIHHHSDRLLTLINDIIKLSEMDSDSTEVIYEDINLTDIVKESMRMLLESAEQHSVTINTDCDEKAVVKGSQSMLEELVTNLANNAISYNRPGGNVWISVRNIDGHVVLTVKDNGIGIPEKHKERVFERFYRVDKSRSKRSGGTGLGLAIVKHIAASLNA
ncbi:MAG: ATP-binding protein, partial [Clostridia bacterium]|nr:ATP-binding protein [Clostridia bacterium]